ncbi:MAG: pyruvate dehydrogenase (acetyl-transferring) E1 component subunit alpha [Herpetosiphon sp.]
MASTPEVAAKHAGLSNDELLEMYRQMLLIREFEEKCQEAYTRAQIGGFLHLYVGEEAIGVGSINALRPEDHLLTHYRDHGHAIARGLDTKAMMAELFGKATGCAGGLGGSMHLVDVSKNFWGGYAIVGSHLLIACGIGTAIKIRGDKQVVIVFFGDGSTNGGDFYEAMNFAQLGKLPVIFMCENNLVAMGTPIEIHSSVTELYKKATAANMRAERVNGNDVIEMYEATKRAIEHADAGNGPTLIEAMSYRFRGHSAQDTQRYRTKEDVERARQGDPIATFHKRLMDEGILSAEQEKQMLADVQAEIDAAVKFADESPPADEKWLDPMSAYAKPIPSRY